MASDKSDDLFPHLRNPEGTQTINQRCVLRTQDGHRVVLISGIPLAQYAVGDHMAEAHTMVNLVDQGWADQNDVAKAFGCSVRTLRRHQRRFEEGGLPALGRARGYPKGLPRLGESVTRGDRRRRELVLGRPSPPLASPRERTARFRGFPEGFRTFSVKRCISPNENSPEDPGRGRIGTMPMRGKPV